MALLAVGRRLPVLRYLSALASNQSDNVFGVHTRSVGHYSSASGSGSTKDEPGKAGADSESPTASASIGEATKPGEVGPPPTSTSQPATVGDDEVWTEVVHSSGQLYYWNQRTGETTQLGEPKPKAERGGGGGGGGSGSGAAGADGESAGHGGGGGGRAADETVHDPRAEAPLEDRTGTYAAMGVLIGAFLGWVSQFV